MNKPLVLRYRWHPLLFKIYMHSEASLCDINPGSPPEIVTCEPSGTLQHLEIASSAYIGLTILYRSAQYGQSQLHACVSSISYSPLIAKIGIRLPQIIVHMIQHISIRCDSHLPSFYALCCRSSDCLEKMPVLCYSFQAHRVCGQQTLKCQ